MKIYFYDLSTTRPQKGVTNAENTKSKPNKQQKGARLCKPHKP